MKEKTLQTNIAVNGLYDTKLCGSVLCQTDHCNVVLKCLFIYLNFCYYCQFLLTFIFHKVM